MHSSAPDTSRAEQVNSLKKLLACDQLAILTHAAGGNSKVFCVEADGRKWAVKSYPPYAPNQRDRLQAEALTYQFLNQQHISSVPTFKTTCVNNRLLIIDWIDGEIPTPASINNNDIDQAIEFIAEIAKLNKVPSAAALPLAAEACLSLDILIDQIEKRLVRLQQHADTEAELKTFLETEFIPLFKNMQTQSRQKYQVAGLATDTELALAKRSLIPADFGFHNSLRDSAGKLHFFDFDYFGWDDPVKLLADLLWHPKMSFDEMQAQQFIDGIAAIYGNDTDFRLRFQTTLPLFGLRWTLILLNEFIPAFWQNRQHAEVHANQIAAKQKQLQLARHTLTRTGLLY